MSADLGYSSVAGVRIFWMPLYRIPRGWCLGDNVRWELGLVGVCEVGRSCPVYTWPTLVVCRLAGSGA